MVHDGAEFIVGDEFGVATDSTQRAQDFGSSDILGGCDPFEVGGRVVEFVAVEVVALIAFRSWSMEGGTHKDVTGFVAEIAHNRISPMHVRTPFSHSRAVTVFESEAVLVDEIAVGMGKEDFAVNELRRHRSVPTSEKPHPRELTFFLITHNTPPVGGI